VDILSASSGDATVFALLRNEYHGWEHGATSTSGHNVTSRQNAGPASCSWNPIPLARSTEGGRHFAHAASPFPLEPDASKFGFDCPSHILKVSRVSVTELARTARLGPVL
jgi:hypothetical protein